MTEDSADTTDAIWRPDYRGPPPVSAPTRLPSFESPSGAATEPTPRRRPPGRRVVGIVAVVGLSIGGVLLATDSEEELPDATAPAPADADDDTIGTQADDRLELPDLVAVTEAPFGGADPRRLPDTLDPIWSRSDEVAGSDDVWVEVVDRRFVLVSIGGDQTLPEGSSTLRSLDAETGVLRWSTNLSAPPSSVVFVATNATSIVLVVGSVLTGIDSDTGDELWSIERSPALPASDVRHLVGTDLLAIGSPDETSTLVDMTTGVSVGQFDGPTITTDHLGRWFLRRGGDIVRYDLGDGFRGPTVVATGVADPVVAVVGGDVLSAGPQGWTTSNASDDADAASARVVVEGTEGLPTAAAVLAMSGNTFVVAGTGTVVGAELDGTRIRAGWQRDGALVAMYPTERGFLVHTASRGGADQTIFDGLDGDAVVTFTLTPGLFDALVVAGNGILTKIVGADGPRLAGLDLDGVEIWSISGVTAASVGDRLIVTTTRLDDGTVRLDAIGEPRTP